MKRLSALLTRVRIFAFISTVIYFYWGTTWYTQGQEPSDNFPVVIQISDRNPPHYAMFRWSELKELLQKEPELSLVLPVGEHRIELEPDQGFTPTLHFRVTEARTGQHIMVRHNTDDYMFRSIYRVMDNVIQPERLRIGHGMMVLGAVILGSIVTVFLRWLYGKAR